jgi:hypothetical protein
MITMVLLATFPFNIQAQKRKVKTDTLLLIREFMQISNLYKQLPLTVQFDVKQTTNVDGSGEDTSVMNACFLLDKNVSYVRLGEMEQFITDSLTLVVSDQMQRMFLYTNSLPVEERIKLITGIQLKDSSIQQIAKKYRAQNSALSEKISSIQLLSRNMFFGTSISKEIIELQYDTKKKVPIKLITFKRSLVPLEEETYKALSNEPGKLSMLLSAEGKRYFFIKEQAISFLYKEIGHETPTKFTVDIKDRIKKNNEGEFVPVKNYEAYTITIN